MKSKEEQSAQFEHKLHEQVQSIRERNRDEIEELQRNTRAMLEAENRACRFARDAAVQAQQQLERELKLKGAQHDELLQSFNELKSVSDNRITTIDADIKMKCFELERLQLLFDESQASIYTKHVCVYIYVHLHLYVHLYVNVYVYVYVYKQLHLCPCMLTCALKYGLTCHFAFTTTRPT